MTLLKNWLLGVVAAALAVALAQALTPEGSVKKVGRLVGSLVLILAVVRPFLTMDLEKISLPAFYTEGGEGESSQGGEEVMKTLIGQKVGAYIVDKGAELGFRCNARVTVVEDETGWPVPWQVEIIGDHTQEQEKALSQTIARELDIPADRQTFGKEEP